MQALGITKNGPDLQIALLGKSRKGYEIQQFHSFDVKQLDILLDVLKNDQIASVTGIDAKNVIFRKKSFSLASKRKLDAILPFEIESLLPYPPEEGIISLVQRKLDKKNRDVSFFAIKKNCLESHLSSWQEAGIDPKIVSSIPSALYQLTSLLFKDHTCILTIHLGAQEVSIVAVVEGNLVSSHSIPLESKELLAKQIERYILFIKQKMKVPSDIEIFLCSDQSSLPEIKAYFKSHFNTYSFLENESLFNVPFEIIEKYAINLGLAIDALEKPDRITQFRSIKSPSSSFTAAWEKRIKIYSLIGTSLLALTLMSGEFLVRKKEKALFIPFTKEFNLESSSGPLQKEELIHEVIQLEKKIAKQKKSFPYLPTLPSVSDLISYLSSLDAGPIEIHHLRYHLEKYPKIEHEPTSYIVKIELDYQVSSQQAGKQFFEALKSNSRLVDPQKKSSFSFDQNLCKTTFYLKGE